MTTHKAFNALARWVLAAICIVSLWLLLGPRADAQAANVPAQLTLNWVLPTKAQNGQDLTGALALTGVQVFISQASIPDASALQPVATIAAGTTTTQTINAPNGATLYVRLKACNVGGCSPFSNEATKLVSVPTPGAPTSISVALTITTG